MPSFGWGAFRRPIHLLPGAAVRQDTGVANRATVPGLFQGTVIVGVSFGSLAHVLHPCYSLLRPAHQTWAAVW